MIDRQHEPTAAHERAQERLAAALALLDAGIGAIVDGARFRAYLATLARFPTYSARTRPASPGTAPGRRSGGRSAQGSGVSASSPLTGASSPRATRLPPQATAARS